MSDPITDEELIAYLDHELPPDRAAVLDAARQADAALAARVDRLTRDLETGAHSVGSIWRRFALSCPSREDLADSVQGLLEPGLADYVRFHVETVGCVACRANLDDLGRRQAGASAVDEDRQRRERIERSGTFDPRA